MSKLREELYQALADEWGTIHENKDETVRMTRIVNVVVRKLALLAGIEKVAYWPDAESHVLGLLEGGSVREPVATGVEAMVCADITKRQEVGLKKYGCSVANSTEGLKAFLSHAYHESLDFSIYLRKVLTIMEDATESEKPPGVAGRHPCSR